MGDGCEMEEVPLFIPRQITEVLALPIVTILNTYCRLSTKEQEWDIHMYTPNGMPVQVFREQMANDSHDSVSEYS